jgi:hypothetical protein
MSFSTCLLIAVGGALGTLARYLISVAAISFLVRARKPAIADNFRDQNRRELSGLAHRALSVPHVLRFFAQSISLRFDAFR